MHGAELGAVPFDATDILVSLLIAGLCVLLVWLSDRIHVTKRPYQDDDYVL